MLQAHDLTLSYGGRNIVEGLSLDLPERGLSIIIGPNGCGKSIVLKALGRLLKPKVLDSSPRALVGHRAEVLEDVGATSGQVRLDGSGRSVW